MRVRRGPERGERRVEGKKKGRSEGMRETASVGLQRGCG